MSDPRYPVTSTTPNLDAAALGGLPAAPENGDFVARLAGVWSRFASSTVGRNLLAAADKAAARSAIDAETVGAAAAITTTSLGAVPTSLLTTRGDLIRRGATAAERLAGAQAADTFVGGDGTDVGVRTAAQVKTSLGLSTVTATGATIAAAQAAIYAPPSAYMGPFTATAYLGGDALAAAPTLAKGTSVVVQFYKSGALAGAGGVLVAHLTSGVTEGWDLGYSSGTGNLFLFLKGINSDATMGLVGWDTLSNGPHGLAVNFIDDGGTTGHLQWALDGVAQSNISAAGTYVPPTTSTPLLFGRHPAGTSPCLLAEIAAMRAYSTALSSGDLLTASTPATTIPTLTGTVSFDLNSARDFWPGQYNCLTSASGTQWSLTVNGGLTRRVR